MDRTSLDTLVHAALSPACGILYAEDFDDDPAPAPDPDPPPPGPVPPQPVFTAAELDEARTLAAEDARMAALESAELVALHGREVALAGIAGGLDRLGEGIGAEVGRATTEVSRAVLSLLCAALPSLMAGTARREVSGLLHRLLPGLHAEKQVTVRLNPHLMDAMDADLAGLDEEHRARIVLVPTDALLPGDLRVSWHDGRLVRDTDAIHRAARDILAASGYAEAAHV